MHSLRPGVPRGLADQGKHAVKGGEPLHKEEIVSLLKTYVEQGIPLTCPHGRPVVARLSKRDMEKMFKRIV